MFRALNLDRALGVGLGFAARARFRLSGLYRDDAFIFIA